MLYDEMNKDYRSEKIEKAMTEINNSLYSYRSNKALERILRTIKLQLEYAFNRGYELGHKIGIERAEKTNEINIEFPIEVVMVKFRSDKTGYYDVCHLFQTPEYLPKGVHVAMLVKNKQRHGITAEQSRKIVNKEQLLELIEITGATLPLKPVLGTYVAFDTKPKEDKNDYVPW